MGLVDARLSLLMDQAAFLMSRVKGLPIGSRDRKVAEYELHKVRVEIRDMRRVKREIAAQKGRRQLVPYAGKEGD